MHRLKLVKRIQYTMADLAQTHANGVATDKTEWYGGATRFELELEVQHQFTFSVTVARSYHEVLLC